MNMKRTWNDENITVGLRQGSVLCPCLFGSVTDLMLGVSRKPPWIMIRDDHVLGVWRERKFRA